MIEYELELFEKERDHIRKLRDECIKIIDEKMPYKRYFEILDEIKKVQGTKEINSERMIKLISEGAEIERNMVDLTKKLQLRQDKAREDIFELDQKLGYLNNQIAINEIKINRGQ